MLERSKRLVVLIGLPGSGKTSLSTWLRDHAEIVVVSRDVIRAAMFEQCQYTDEEKRAAFEAMKAALVVSLQLGISVCTDGVCFSRRQEVDQVIGIGKVAGAQVRVFHCVCPVEIAQQRVEHDRRVGRPGNPVDRTADLVARVAAEFDPVPDFAFEIDMTQSVEAIGRQVMQRLGA